MTGDAALDRVVGEVQASSKYRHVWPEFTRRLSSLELAHGRSPKEAVKAVKNKLHQVGAAYASPAPDYAAWLAALEKIDRQADPQGFQQACRQLMAAHASTRERLPLLEEIYQVSLADVAPVNSVLDAACGLNPLAIPWMPLAPGAVYTACDIYLDLLAFLQAFIPLTGMAGAACPCDLTAGVPAVQADVVLLMKSLPCLEQVDKQVSARLLDTLRTRHILVSFPSLSLGGRSRGMDDYYPAHLAALTQGRDWSVRRFDFDGEIVFRLDR